MRKIKKSLAVILAALMLASFMPLFASAAISLTRSNIEIVPPSASPTEIDYGTTMGDITFTGGECWYIDPDTGTKTKVEGEFKASSATTKPAVSEAYAPTLKFYPTDTETYGTSSGSLLSSLTTIKSGTWPTIKVKGKETVLATAPTAAEIQVGQQLRTATLSGGVVNDADGNSVTGSWSYVNATTYPTASGKYEVQFKATGYETLKVDIDVTVTSSGTATLSEAPTVKYYLAKGEGIATSVFEGGKVVDADGTEITNGQWMFVNDENVQLASEIKLETEGTFTYKAVWLSAGLPPVFADIPITVYGGYTVDRPRLSTPVPYVQTKGELPFVYGNASVPGTYTIDDPEATLSSNTNTTQRATVTFTPENALYKPTTWSYSFKVKENDVWYTQPEEPVKIVVPYGFSSDSVIKGSAVSWPDYLVEQGVDNFHWVAKNYDIKSMEVGDIQLVSGYMRKGGILGYASIAADAYIQIQPGVHDGDMGSLTATYVRSEENIALRLFFNVPGATGKVNIKYGDTVIATLTPDENGKIDERVSYKPTQNGTYSFTAEYTPGLMDKVTIENPSVTSNSVDVKFVVERNITIKIGNEVFEFVYPEGGTFSKMWGSLSSRAFENVADYWVFTDGDGNEFIPVSSAGVPVVTTQADLNFVVPEHDVIITAKMDSGEDAETEESGLWAFWQKLINFIIEIYRIIDNLFHIG